jgi:uncharacterized protein YjbI with pentapeptide repeats
MSSPLDTPHPDRTQRASEWRKHWQKVGQVWRTQPEISEQRQKDLIQLQSRAIPAQRAPFPFKDEVLSRADVEWLLAMHESHTIYGPIDISNELHIERAGINLAGANLANCDLSSLPLARLNGSASSQRSLDSSIFTSINLEKANLAEAHLEEAHLVKANLKQAHLTGAYLAEAQLAEAQLEGAFFNEADLEQADLTACMIANGHFIKACLERASLRDACLEDASFNEASMEGVDARDACIGGANFSRAQLRCADFRRVHTDQKRVSFQQALLEQAEFQEAHLEGADFRDAHLEGADFRDAHLEGANFRDAHLEGADLRGAHLEGTDLRGAHLNGKKRNPESAERVRRRPGSRPESAILSPADLREAFFNGGTRLHGTVLGDAEYGFVSVADLSWGDVNLSAINWEQVHRIGDEQRARTRQGDKRDAVGKARVRSSTRQNARRAPKKGTEKIHLEEYRTAVRANRQLAHILQNQGLNEVAARFSYRSQKLHLIVLQKEGKWVHWLFSALLDLLAGYGYKPVRSFLAYLTVVVIFMIIYHIAEPGLSWGVAFVFSVATFGRGLIPGASGDMVTNLVAYASVFEAFIGLVIEATFIAALTQRFFSK